MANISEPQLIRLIDAHIKKECPNYYKGFCDAKDKPCSWHREEEPFTNRGITCGWLGMQYSRLTKNSVASTRRGNKQS